MNSASQKSTDAIIFGLRGVPLASASPDQDDVARQQPVILLAAGGEGPVVVEAQPADARRLPTHDNDAAVRSGLRQGGRDSQETHEQGDRPASRVPREGDAGPAGRAHRAAPPGTCGAWRLRRPSWISRPT